MDTLKWEIVRYESARKQRWDSFVRDSRNATFLFLRDYMEYHSDRFEDHSLLAYRNGKLVAILPANAVGDTLYSHQGLTYGGWLLPMRHIDAGDVICLFEAWNDYALAHGFRGCVYKPVACSRRPLCSSSLRRPHLRIPHQQCDIPSRPCPNDALPDKVAQLRPTACRGPQFQHRNRRGGLS